MASSSSFDHMLPPTERMPYTIITPQYSPHTTVAISLRHFEKQSKHQAEQEYDDEHGVLPEPPAEDDPSIDIQERSIQKKKRKVRSAIVSRRKNAIYEKTLEQELHHRDHVNRDLKTRLDLFRDVLDNIRMKISALEKNIAGKSGCGNAQAAAAMAAAAACYEQEQMQQSHAQVLKRARVNGMMFSQGMMSTGTHGGVIPQTHQLAQQHQQQQQAMGMFFFPNEQVVGDVLNGNVGMGATGKGALESLQDVDFSSECSDRQISPVIPPANADFDQSCMGNLNTRLPSVPNAPLLSQFVI